MSHPPKSIHGGVCRRNPVEGGQFRATYSSRHLRRMFAKKEKLARRIEAKADRQKSGSA